MSFEPLRHILSRSIKGHTQESAQLQIARVFDLFHRVMLSFWQEERAQYVLPVSWREGVLKVETRSPAAKQQFQLDLPRIKNEINRQLGVQLVKKIIIQSKGF